MKVVGIAIGMLVFVVILDHYRPFCHHFYMREHIELVSERGQNPGQISYGYGCNGNVSLNIVTDGDSIGGVEKLVGKLNLQAPCNTNDIAQAEKFARESERLIIQSQKLRESIDDIGH